MRIKSYYNKFIYLLSNTVYDLFVCKAKDTIELNAWIRVKRGQIVPRNFGDELNIYLLKGLTGCPLHIYNSRFHRCKQNFVVVGSLIDGFIDEKSIIWGSGIRTGKRELPFLPKEVLAVRGRLTRDFLLERGVSCPEVYGDPALLMPLVYTPKIDKKYKVGIIPHYRDIHLTKVQDFIQNNKKSAKLIRFDKYDDWHSIIDEICQCEYIVSSSLHGLILADAYNIPNLWIELSSNIKEGHFKYLDYFSGVGRVDSSPYLFLGDESVDFIVDELKSYHTINFDKESLLSACPFNIKSEFILHIENQRQ